MKSSSRYSLVAILPTSSSQVLRMWHSFNILIELSIQSCALFFSSTTFADRGPKPRKQRPYFGDHGSHFTRKTQGFGPESHFKPEFTWGSKGYTSQLLDDDVVDTGMMMWLTSWWECWPWQSSVTRMFSTQTSFDNVHFFQFPNRQIQGDAC